jgi:quercetin dioxygenase-like cupin family protein
MIRPTMMKRLTSFLLGCAAGAAIAGGAVYAAQVRHQVRDAVLTSPQLYSVRIDNDRVRVLDYHLPPGEIEPLHSHHSGVAYVIEGATLRNVAADGTRAEGLLKAGDVHWREDNIVHAVENIGQTEMRALIIELKDKN